MRARRIQHEPCRARLPEKYVHEQGTTSRGCMHNIEALRATMELVTLEEELQNMPSPKRDG